MERAMALSTDSRHCFSWVRSEWPAVWGVKKV